MDKVKDLLSDVILTFDVLLGTEAGSFLIRMALIILMTLPLAGFIFSLTLLVTSKLEKPQPTKKQQVDTLRMAVNQLGTKIENIGIGKTKRYSEFEKMIKLADNPWGLSSREWLVVLIAIGALVFILVLLQSLFDLLIRKTFSPPIFSMVFWPISVVLLMFFYLRGKAKKREKILQYDFMRAFNRLGDLEKETAHRMLEISLAGTRLLKNYIPRIDVFKNNPQKAMEEFASKFAMDEAILFKNTVLNIINNPENKQNQIMHAEMGIQKARSADEAKSLKMLQVGFETFIYGPFCVAAGVLVLPWYQFLKHQLGKLLGW